MNPRQGIETFDRIINRRIFLICRKTVNPRQGIETQNQTQDRRRIRRLERRKTVNPRQGIETSIAKSGCFCAYILGRKTVNPRQGIETYSIEYWARIQLLRSEDSESSSGD